MDRSASRTEGRRRKDVLDMFIDKAVIAVKAGSGGAEIIKDIVDITLYDIYKAADCVEGGLFNFHENPNPECPVGKNIHIILDEHLLSAQTAMENSLKAVTLADLAKRLKECNK